MFRRLFVLLALLVPFCALPAGAAAPVLVVYPFAVNGSAPDDLGVQLANQIAAEIAALGGIKIVRGAASAKPADYRAAARTSGAEVYLSGSIQPVFGTSYSVIEQLVSTQTGLVRWSVTTHFRTLADLSGDGGRVRDVMLAGEPTPPPGIAANGSALVTPAPSSGFAVLPVTGSALDGDRAYAQRSIVETLQRRGFTAVPVKNAASGALDLVADGPSICTAMGTRTLVAATLDTTRVATSANPQTTAHVAFRTYDCRTSALDAQPTVVNHIAPIANDAIAGAVEDAISALPSPS
jgi:hypothetical protein